MSRPDLSIVVLTYNGEELLPDCLASIDAQEIPCSYEKIVVDNGSDAHRSFTVPNNWRVHYLPENIGHIAGQNKCFEVANGEWVLFVANDVRMLNDTKCIEGMWRFRSHLGITQPMLFTPDLEEIDNLGLHWEWPGYALSRKNRRLSINSVTSTCYLMKKELWQRCGGFDEQLKTSHEDIELGLRLAKTRVFPLCTSEANAIHLGNATLRHQPSHNRAAFHADRLYVVRKHYRGVDRWLRVTIITVIDYMLGLFVRAPKK